MNQQVPYNTGKVKMGSMYAPPRRNYVSVEGEFIQRMYLKETKPTDGRIVAGAVAACVMLVIAMVLL